MEPELKPKPDPGDGVEYSGLHPWHECVERSEKKGVDHSEEPGACYHTQEYKHQLTRVQVGARVGACRFMSRIDRT